MHTLGHDEMKYDTVFQRAFTGNNSVSELKRHWPFFSVPFFLFFHRTSNNLIVLLLSDNRIFVGLPTNFMILFFSSLKAS